MKRGGTEGSTPRRRRQAGSAASQRGRVQSRTARGATAGDPSLDYFCYLPTQAVPDAPLLVAVHGFSRNAAEQVESFAPLCERAGVVLAAPHFPERDFPDFQRLGRTGRGSRSDHALEAMLADLRGHLGWLLGRVTLCGYSGGGQFAHRYLMAYPGRLMGAVVAAPGWFTFPFRDLSYPYGLRVGNRLPGVRLRPESFLRVPVLVAVGEEDDDPDSENLRHSPALDAQQGSTRVERAARWVRAMQEEAYASGLPSRVRLAILPGAGHSFPECMEAGLGELVLEQIGSDPARARVEKKQLVDLED